jgi:glycosyltransferase involved in cell wall biosynthesis
MLDIDKNYLQNKANEIGDPSIVEDILFTGYVPNHELPAIYSLATVFLYPSLRESFGIPLVEAMCCEVPVITSNTSSMPEIVGDAALICDPFDENAIAKAINDLLNNNDLSQSLSLKGKIQGNYFNWEKNASETLKIYQSIVPNENEF